MGYSPGFLLKIGRFRTLANSHGIFTNILKNSWKSLSSMQATFQRVWDDFRTYQNPPSSKPWAIAQHLTESLQRRRFRDDFLPKSDLFSQAFCSKSVLPKSALFKTMGYSPGFLLKIGRFRTLANSHGIFTNKPKNSYKSILSMQATFRKFGTISRTYQNPPSSKPWAIAQAFCSKSVDFGHLPILPESLQTSPKPVTYQNPPSSKPWAIAQAFSISDPCEFSRNLYEQAQKPLEIHFQACRRRFRDSNNFSPLPKSVSKPWAIAQGFCSKSVDFGPLRILPESLRTSPKTVRNQFSSM